MAELRDYRQWHRTYDDPDSGLSWRLGVVRSYLTHELDRRSGPVRILSLCSGDGRDVIGVLSERTDAGRIHVALVELDPEIAADARTAADAAGLHSVAVRVGDAGRTTTFADLAPADIVVLVGIFGNISDHDLRRTIRAAPQMCRPGATVIWSRGRDLSDRDGLVRASFAEAGFIELEHSQRDDGSRPALGSMRYDGPAVPLETEQQLFTFLR